MRLLVTTPVSIVVDAGDVRHVRAEDETGAFGILQGHSDFITVLSISVITWRDDRDKEHHVAVRGGVLTVRNGNIVEVATREAVGEETLQRLGKAVLDRFREEAQTEEQWRVSAARLHLAAIRQIQRYMESGRQSVPQGPPPKLGARTPGDGLSENGEIG